MYVYIHTYIYIYIGNLVNPNKKLTLQSVVTSTKINSLKLKWRVAFGGINIDMSANGDSRSSLVFPENTLIPGQNYGFELSAQDTEGISKTTVYVTVNTPPSGGTFTVSPPSGRSGVTSFALIASGWSTNPNNYPLSYIFYVANKDSSGALVSRNPLSGVQLNQVYNTTLPIGVDSNNRVFLQVDVSDAYGATVTIEINAIVMKPVQDGEEVGFVQDQTSSNGRLAKKIALGDPLLIVNTINEITSVLNNASVLNSNDVYLCTGIKCKNGGRCILNTNGRTYGCSCINNWSGVFCETSAADQKIKIESRNSLFNAMIKANEVTAPDINSISQQANILQSVTSATGEVDKNLNQKSIDALGNLVNSAATHGFANGLEAQGIYLFR